MHTPGPWIAEGEHGCVVYFKDPRAWPGYPPIVCRTSIANGQIERKQAQANARLIAAAPKLLEALEGAIPKLRHETEACAVARVGTCARCAADAAIAEAKGRE